MSKQGDLQGIEIMSEFLLALNSAFSAGEVSDKKDQLRGSAWKTFYYTEVSLMAEMRSFSSKQGDAQHLKHLKASTPNCSLRTQCVVGCLLFLSIEGHFFCGGDDRRTVISCSIYKQVCFKGMMSAGHNAEEKHSSFFQDSSWKYIFPCLVEMDLFPLPRVQY